MAASDFWWNAEEVVAHKHVFGTVRALEEAQKHVHELNIRNARLYGNCDIAIDWTSSKRDYSRGSRVGSTTENVIQSVVDTATSMIAKNKPKASFVTDGAEWSTQQKAKLLGKFIEGVFETSGIWQEGPSVFRDGGIFGTGAVKIFEEDGRIATQRVLIDEIIVDENECRSCMPRQMFQRQFVDKNVLKALYPDAAVAIETAHSDEGGSYHTSYSKVDSSQAVVVEAWHLPSAKGAKDGKHSICIDGKTLLWEEWDKDNFPFEFYRWSEPIVGFYGQGLAEQLTGIQLRINKLNRFIDRAQDLIAVPRVFVDVASKTLKAQLTNEIGQVIPYRGKPPTFHTPQAVGPEIYQYKEQLKASAFEFAGISRLSAQSQKPVGLESAVALREFSDIETQRFAIQAQCYEHFYLRVARQMVDLAKDIHGKNKNFKSVFLGRNTIERINWTDVDMDEDRFVMRIEASSMLSRTPAGRLQGVIEMAQAGLIDTDEARRLMDHPDLPASQDLNNAALNEIDAQIEKHLDGEWSSPEPFQNLPLGIKRFQLAYLKAKREGAPENVLEGLRRWMENAQRIIEPPAPPVDLAGALPAEGIPPEALPQEQPQAALAPQAQFIQPSSTRSV